MWPNGPQAMTTNSDDAWKGAIGGKTYMMGVSPWFFHSASGGKTWLWKGDDLWADRWAQTLQVQPEFVQYVPLHLQSRHSTNDNRIVTWNDYGESSYIGPVHSDSETPAGSRIYVQGMPHDSWRDFLPYYIAKYKGSEFTISKDQAQFWYRSAPAAAGSTCGVTGNSADQGQQEYSPNDLLEDRIFFSALLKADAQVLVSVGGGPADYFEGKTGINHWSVPFNGRTGIPRFRVERDGATSISGEGLKEITASTTLSDGCTNYNAFVGSF